MCYYKSLNNEADYLAAMCQFVTVQTQNKCLQKYCFLNNKIKKMFYGWLYKMCSLQTEVSSM